MPSKSRRDLIYDLLAPPLILATPFASFVNYNDYGFARTEVWLILGGLIALGLLSGVVMALGGQWARIILTTGLVTFFVDLQFDWLDQQPEFRVPAFGIGMLLLSWLLRAQLSRITMPVFATMLVATLVLPGSSGASFSHPGQRLNARTTPVSARPVVVHLILDEFIGVAGIPSTSNGEAVRARLRSLLLENGFRVFGHAYSRFVYTTNAIPNTLNYASVPKNAHFIEGNKPRQLRQNKYFERMYHEGYNIHVYQSEYMDLCTGYENMLVSCHTNRDTGIEPLAHSNLSAFMKTWLALNTFIRLAVLCRGFGYGYNALRQKAQSRGYDLPQWVLNKFALWAVQGVRTLQEIEDDVSTAAAGEMFFAHLLFPHQPYVFDPTCKARDPQDWEMSDDDPPLPPNSDASRFRRYGLYLQQILCINALLQGMFERWRQTGVYDRMLIIIQGDHGSRIWLHMPIAANKDRLVPSDYTDAFSTLFAVKAPGLEPAYDTRMLAIQDLLPAVAGAQPLDRLPVSETEPYVFLETQPKVLSEDGTDMVRQPMPKFGPPEGVGISRPALRGLRGSRQWTITPSASRPLGLIPHCG
jgi:hypothetical protein